MNVTKKLQTHRHREQTRGFQWEEGRRGDGEDGVGELEVQTIRHKISQKDIFTTQEIQPILYNNHKRSITFKNCESLYFTPITYNHLYFSLKIPTRKKKMRGQTVTICL